MLVTNQTSSDYWFGPLHLPGGPGQQITVDDTTDMSLYLLNDSVADALNALYAAGKITVSSAADPFPRPTGTPTLFHGDGSPEGLVFAPQGSVYMRRDGTLGNGGVLYLKTTGVTSSTGWLDLATASGASVAPTGTIVAFGGSTPPTGWLTCDGSTISRSTYAALFSVLGTSYGAGDGSTTFNLPDLRGRVGVGWAQSGGHPDVATLGANEGQALAGRRSRHRTSDNKTVSAGSLAITESVETVYSGVGLTGWVADRGYHMDWGDSGGADPSEKYSFSRDDFTVSGAPALGGSIGTNNGNDALDTPSYLVVNHVIKT